MLSYPLYWLVIAFVLGFAFFGVILYGWWKWFKTDPQTIFEKMFLEEKSKFIGQTTAKIKDKNSLIFTVIGLAVARSVAESIKLTYVFREFDQEEGVVYIVFTTDNTTTAYEKANAHLGIINDLLREIATALSFRYRLVGRILEITE